MAPSATIMARLKVQLKLSIARLRNMQQRDEALSKQQRRAMALLLGEGKENSARIRVENIIRMDIMIELNEILELYCELLLARIGMMDSRECDPGLEEAVKSIMYAAPRTECKELQSVRQILAEKFGKEFTLVAAENSDGKVAPKVLKKLSVTPPAQALVEGYLEEIALTYGVDWPKKATQDVPPATEDEDDEDGSSGGQAVLADDGKEASDEAKLSQATPPRSVGVRSPLRVNPPKSTSDNPQPRVKAVGALDLKPSQRMQDATKKTVEKKTPKSDLEELAARFAALKQ